jgi:hypothetical protein
LEKEANMSEPKAITMALDPDAKGIYRAGGVSAFILVIGYLLTFPIYACVGDAPPSGIEAKLLYFAKHVTGWGLIVGLMVLTDFLYIPIFLSLYQALKAYNRFRMRLAVACMGLFVVLDLALTWSAFSVLILSGGRYAAATTDAQRTLVLAAAAFPSALLDSPLLGVYAILIPSIGVLLSGLVMFRGSFSRLAACLALAVGLTGIMFMGSYISPALGLFRIINALLATAWYGCIGWRLCRFA